MTDRAKLIQDFVSALGNDVQQVIELLTPDYKWWIAGVGDIDGQYDDLVASMAPHLQEPLSGKIVDTVIDGDKAAVEVKFTCTLKDGTRYANDYFVKLDFKGDRISSVREYNDTAYAKSVFDRFLNS